MSDVQLTVVEGDVAQVIGAIPGPQGPAGAVAAAIDGSAALPSIAFASDTDTGLYRVGANQLGVSTGGTQRLVIDETGQIEATSLGTAAAPTWTFVGDPDTGIYSPGANQLALATNGSGRIIIDSFGSVRFPDGGLYGKSDNTGAIGVYGGGAFNQGAGGVFYSSSHPATPNLISFVNGAFVERLRITATGQLSHIGAGSSGSPAVSFNGSAASNSLVVDSNSRVGIGTSSPGTTLDVRGNATFTGNATARQTADFTNTGGQLYTGVESSAGGAVFTGSSAYAGIVGTNNSTNLQLATNGAIRATLDTSGRLGIGTTSPSNRLHVSGGRIIAEAVDQYAIQLQQGATIGGLIGAPAASSIGFYATGGSEYGRFDSSGRLGIGTSSPAFALDVQSGDLRIKRSASDDAALYFGNSTNNYIFGSNTNNLFAFATNGSEKLRITSAGNVGIGASSPATKLHVLEPAATDVEIRAANSVSYMSMLVDSTGVGKLVAPGGTMTFTTGGSERARIRSDGMFEVKGAGTAGASPAVSVSGSAPANSAIVDSSGRLLVGTSTNTGGSLFQVNDNRIRIATAKTPASATDTGSAGEICWDANYIYVCTATNTWKRTAISTW